MNFTALTELYKLISSMAPGYNENSAIDDLRRAARTFCQDTLISQETQETAFAANDITVGLDSPNASYVYVHCAMWITCPRGDIPIKTLGYINANFSNWRSATSLGSPCFAANENRGELAIIPGAKLAESPVFVRLACVPTISATKIDTMLVDEWGETIADGALGRILRIPNQPWTDPRAASEADRRFNIDTSRARGQANLGRSVTNLQQRIIRW